MRGEVGGKGLDGLGITPLGDEEHPPQAGIGDQGDVIMSTRLRGFVGRHALHFGEVGLRQAQIDVALADGRHLMPERATAVKVISRHSVRISASNSSVKPASFPAQPGSTCRTPPSGNLTRGTRTSN